MHAVIRTYSGPSAKKLFDLIEERKREVEGLIRPITGFVSYSLLRTADGGASVTVCQDKAGCDESARVMFYGANCTLCTESTWTVQRKGM